MKTGALILLAGLAFAPVAATAQTPAPKAADAELSYQTLLNAARTATAESGSAPVDWRALRYAYSDRPSFMGHADDEDRQAMFKAANAGNWPEAQTAANRVIAQSWVDGMAHFILGIALSYQNKPKDALREKAIGQGLIESVKTADGLSFEHAFTVITVAEEYDLMTLMGVHLDNQALSHNGGHTYDVMTTKDRDGKTVVYYFNIDREWASEARMFAPK